jgi:hypothetical protein
VRLLRGLAAGFVGTCALTMSQRVEMALSGRGPSDLPARVVEGVLRVRLRGRRRELAAVAAHWVNNTGSGVGRAALDGLGLSGTPALAGTFVLYLGGEAALFRSLRFEPAALRAVDLVHAAVWALATDAAYDLLERRVDRDLDVPLQGA